MVRTAGITEKLGKAVKSIWAYKPQTLLKVPALPVASLLWLASFILVDNKIIRKLDKSFYKVKNKQGKNSALARKSNMYAHILYYMLMAGIIGGGASSLNNKNKISDKEKPIKDKPIKKDTFSRNEISRGKTYKIESEKDFAKLYQEAMPLICLSMFPTETLNLKAYSDNGKKTKNTIGMGSYWYPKNGNPKSSEWIKVSQHKGVQADNFEISGDRAMDMVDAWARYREDGRVYNKMCKLLMGTELSINEFAAIFTCTYNNEKNGWMLCKYVHDNYNDPIKCASYLGDLPTYGFIGLIDRHCHEALVYLNLDNYIYYIGKFEIKGIGTSVTALEAKEFYVMLKDLRRGKLDGARWVANKIKKRIFKNGKTINQIIKESMSPERAKELINSPAKVSGSLIIFSPEMEFDANAAYKEGIAKYNKGDYKGALVIFQNIVDKGFDGADIHNDLAITYYHLGQYKKAIEESKLVLSMGETWAYSAANFNAGMAYEKLGKLVPAAANFKLAMNRSPEIIAYKNAFERVKQGVKDSHYAFKGRFDTAKTKTAIKQTPKQMTENHKKYLGLNR